MRILLASLLLAAACSSDNKAADASHNPDSAVAQIDSGTAFTLTVDNYLQWCDVTVNGVFYGHTQVVPVQNYTSGTVVPVIAVKAGNFFHFDYWFGTDGDTTAAHDKNMSTSVTMTANKKIQACCPDETDASPLIPCPPPP